MRSKAFTKDLLPEVAQPQWLSDLTPESIQTAAFPLKEILEDSLYYPASGFDGDPIKYLAGRVFSFINVEYGKTEQELEEAIKLPGFKGYQILASRSVTESELTPNGWQPIMPERVDGNPRQYEKYVKKPFCRWYVFERCDDFPASHGPGRFSLLYLCADGAAAYQAIYVANATKPKFVAIIQPGHGFGCNWTDFTDPTKIFARTVLGNKAGRPEYLLYGGFAERHFYVETCWQDYGDLLGFFTHGYDGNIGVWRRNDSR